VGLLLVASLLALNAAPAVSQEQSRESMAVDATAAQWSFQLAYEGFFDYHDDAIGPGVVRPKGNEGFLQFRLVAPIPKDDKFPITLLPRLTLRAVQNKDGDTGFGSSDLFILGIAQEWSTGRWGIGPQINFPAGGEEFGNTNWGFGLAAAVTQRAAKDKLYLAFLLQQVWQKPNNGTETLASPIGINPIIVFQLGSGWYLGNGDFVMSYNWQTESIFIPFGLRLGKAFVGEKTTWNAYVEYSTSVVETESRTTPPARTPPRCRLRPRRLAALHAAAEA
jgi:hypothetical protein